MPFHWRDRAKSAELRLVPKVGHLSETNPDLWARMPTIEQLSYDGGWLDASLKLIPEITSTEREIANEHKAFLTDQIVKAEERIQDLYERLDAAQAEMLAWRTQLSAGIQHNSELRRQLDCKENEIRLLKGYGHGPTC